MSAFCSSSRASTRFNSYHAKHHHVPCARRIIKYHRALEHALNVLHAIINSSRCRVCQNRVSMTRRCFPPGSLTATCPYIWQRINMTGTLILWAFHAVMHRCSSCSLHPLVTVAELRALWHSVPLHPAAFIVHGQSIIMASPLCNLRRPLPMWLGAALMCWPHIQLAG
jgi:hypothetical protein